MEPAFTVFPNNRWKLGANGIFPKMGKNTRVEAVNIENSTEPIPKIKPNLRIFITPSWMLSEFFINIFLINYK